jgi:hypothetical protein
LHRASALERCLSRKRGTARGSVSLGAGQGALHITSEIIMRFLISRPLAPLAALCLLAALAGCNTTQTTAVNASLAATAGAAAAVSPKAAKALTKVNTTIGNASAKVAAYCPLIQAVIGADCLAVSLTTAGAKACTAARPVLASVCASAGSTTDIVGAAQAVESVIQALSQAGVI